MYTVVLICQGEAHFIASVEVGFNSSELIYTLVKLQKEKFEASVPIRIETESPSCVAIRCAAHFFQLVLKVTWRLHRWCEQRSVP